MEKNKETGDSDQRSQFMVTRKRMINVCSYAYK